MRASKSVSPKVSEVVPSGRLLRLAVDEIKPSLNNPRHLFDDPALQELKKNIAEHGVLVPITVYQPKGQTKFSILDGERRYRCVLELNDEEHVGKDGNPLTIPANIVEPPSKIAGMLYMFSIHNFREDWELMPTALGLEIVMNDLRETDNKALNKLTGLSEPQIERCKKLLKFPKKYQKMSLEIDPKDRVPSNFWIEALPVIDLAENHVSKLKNYSRHELIDMLVEKYWAKAIKSVIHFRRIMESYELSEDDETRRKEVLDQIGTYFKDKDLETRKAFDKFVIERKKIGSALEVCEDFVKQLEKLKLRFTPEDKDRKALRKALENVRAYCRELEQALRGEDDPDLKRD